MENWVADLSTLFCNDSDTLSSTEEVTILLHHTQIPAHLYYYIVAGIYLNKDN